MIWKIFLFIGLSCDQKWPNLELFREISSNPELYRSFKTSRFITTYASYNALGLRGEEAHGVIKHAQNQTHQSKYEQNTYFRTLFEPFSNHSVT